jgi:hypothetical protein
MSALTRRPCQADPKFGEGGRTVTEAEWLACEAPDDLLEHLGEPQKDRKHRLFACSCARRLWAVYPDDCCRHTVELAERFADCPGDPSALKAAWDELMALQAADRSNLFGAGWGRHSSFNVAAYVANWRMDLYFSKSVAGVAVVVAACVAFPDIDIDEEDGAKWNPATAAVRAVERATQAALLRDIFGNPFRPAAFSPEWRTDTAVSLARQMYESRDFDAMPILADALQDAGCGSVDILGHCRGPGPHVRGCWVVDLVLGRA